MTLYRCPDFFAPQPQKSIASPEMFPEAEMWCCHDLCWKLMALDKDVVVAAPAAIHADLNPVVQQQLGKLGAGELRAPRFREGRL
jgi:hypothetical protein